MSDTKNDPTKKSEAESNGVTRRDFIKNAAVGGAGFMIVPRHVLGRGMTPPSDLLNIAGVGIGGMGRSNLIALASQNITALCDVDWDYAGKAFERLSTDIEHLQTRVNQAPAGGQAQSQTRSGLNSSTPEQQLANMKRLYTEHWQKAKRYKDYREMLEKQKDIDAVVVATSDHMHTPIALAAMELGKHVYVQKPLTWSVAEARALAKKAKETKVATQMAIKATLPTKHVSPSNMFSPAPSAKSAKFTSGQIARSVSGRKAFLAPKRSPFLLTASSGTAMA